MSCKKIDLSNPDLKKSLPSDIQYVPCNISHNGKINLKSHFEPYIIKNEKEETMEATFRGYPFVGKEMKVPENHTGLILQESKAVSGEETLKPVSSFDAFTYWNWDRTPSVADKYHQAMGWMGLSGVIHEE